MIIPPIIFKIAIIVTPAGLDLGVLCIYCVSVIMFFLFNLLTEKFCLNITKKTALTHR
jgi:hypothetical protein